LGSFLLVLFGLTSNFTSVLSLKTAKTLGVSSYEDLVRSSLGPLGSVYFSVTMALTPLIGNCAHMQAVSSLFGDMLIWFVLDKPTLEGGEWHLEKYKQALLIVLLLVVALPYCFEKSIGALHWIGSALVFVVTLLCSMFVGYCIYLLCTDHQVENPVPFAHWDAEGLFRAAGAVCFAYTSLMALFPVLSDMSSPSTAPKVVAASSITCFMIYLATALAGAWAFGAATQSNCIYNILPGDRMAFRLPVLALVAMVTLLYPIINFPMVTAVEGLVGESRYSRVIISTVGAAIVVCTDMFVKDLVDLFGLCGALGLGSVIYVIPCLCFLKSDPAPFLSVIKVATFFTLILGLLVTVVSSFFVFKHIFGF